MGGPRRRVFAVSCPCHARIGGVDRVARLREHPPSPAAQQHSVAEIIEIQPVRCGEDMRAVELWRAAAEHDDGFACSEDKVLWEGEPVTDAVMQRRAPEIDGLLARVHDLDVLIGAGADDPITVRVECRSGP